MGHGRDPSSLSKKLKQDPETVTRQNSKGAVREGGTGQDRTWIDRAQQLHEQPSSRSNAFVAFALPLLEFFLLLTSFI